jgi:hypothetical protein
MNIGSIGNAGNTKHAFIAANKKSPKTAPKIADEKSELDMLKTAVKSRLAYGNYVQFSEANFRNMSAAGELTVNAETQVQARSDINIRTENILTELLQSAKQGTTRHSLIVQWLTSLRNSNNYDRQREDSQAK